MNMYMCALRCVWACVGLSSPSVHSFIWSCCAQS